jgi:hypothetical protein
MTAKAADGVEIIQLLPSLLLRGVRHLQPRAKKHLRSKP